MTPDKTPDNQDNVFAKNPEYASSDNSNAPRPLNNWEQSPRERQVMLSLIIGSILVIVILMLSFCMMKTPESISVQAPEEAGPYGILQERVDGAFSAEKNGETIPDTASPAHNNLPNATWDDVPPAPQEQPIQEPPLILPENMPAPAPLGQNY